MNKQNEDIAASPNDIDKDQSALLFCLRNQASMHHGGLQKVAEKAGLNRTQIYRALSEDGNPRLSTFLAILKAMDLPFPTVSRYLFTPSAEKFCTKNGRRVLWNDGQPVIGLESSGFERSRAIVAALIYQHCPYVPKATISLFIELFSEIKKKLPNDGEPIEEIVEDIIRWLELYKRATAADWAHQAFIPAGPNIFPKE